MNRMLNAVKLDFLAGESALAAITITYIASIAIGALNNQPIITLVLIMVFAVSIGSRIFSVHEKSRSDKLYGILPLYRHEIVIGRYLYALVIGMVNLAVAFLLTFVMSLIMNTDSNIMTFLITGALSFLYYSFSVSVSYPIFFKFNFSKAYIFTMLPTCLIILISIFIARTSNHLPEPNRFFLFFSENLILIPICGFLVGLMFLTVSALISNVIYARKEI